MASTEGSAGLGGSVPGPSGPATGSIGGQVPGMAAGTLQAQCANALQHLHAWLQVAVAQQPQLAVAIPPLVRAVQTYRMGQYPSCMAQLQSVVGMLYQARASQPTLPPL